MKLNGLVWLVSTGQFDTEWGECEEDGRKFDEKDNVNEEERDYSP